MTMGSGIDMSVEVQNLASLQRDLSKIEDKMTKAELVKMLRPGARILQRAVKQRAPARSGALKRAIRIRTARGKASDPMATVDVYFGKTVTTKKGKRVKPYYALFVHNGTVVGDNGKRIRAKSYTGVGRVRIKPNPFVYDAFESEAQRAAKQIMTNIEKTL